MNPRFLLRIAAGLLMVFAIGHTVVHITRHHVRDPRAREIQRLMIDNKFDMFGQMRSYDDNYSGLSMNMIAALLAFAVITWGISGHIEKDRELVKSILIAQIFAVSIFVITGFVYFFLAPAIIGLVAAVLMGIVLAGIPEHKGVPGPER
jgi:hypothetical protein